MITGSTGIGNGKVVASVDHDPAAVATDVPKGSLIIEESTGLVFFKEDDGDTTNVAPIAGIKKMFITGSVDIDSSVGAGMHNITGVGVISRIRKARFWISANAADVGANVKQPIKLEFFSKDTGENCEDGTDFLNGRLAVVPEFQFASQDVKVAITATDGAVDIDDTADFNAGDLVRIHDGTLFEYQRVNAITDIDTLDIVDPAQNAWGLDDDVARVLELADIEYSDEDGTDEIHLKITPGDAAGDDVRLHYALQVEFDT